MKAYFYRNEKNSPIGLTLVNETLTAEQVQECVDAHKLDRMLNMDLPVYVQDTKTNSVEFVGVF